MVQTVQQTYIPIMEIIDDICNTNNILSDEQKDYFQNELKIEDIIKLKLSVGNKICLKYNLWNTSNPIIFDNNKQSIHPMDLAYIILILVWENLKE